ncbi:MAG: M23 family metallopeptidase [Eubacterium sp.]|nr:M23 family metallopeptidase [Eubacterium sp.]
MNRKQVFLPKKNCVFLIVFIFLFAALDIMIAQMLLLQAESEQSSPLQMTSEQGTLRDDVQEQIIRDLQVFPIPLSSQHPEYQVSYENSWMSARTFGGDRGHEGTDLMVTPDQRGLFPVLSMTDGVVEKKGWLPQGGYRIGIRSPGGIYYYYAHLYDYAENLTVGTPVFAGQWLGFTGDSGYSNIEGTVGNFPVHLHIGIYYNDAVGNEIAVNPYPFLLPLPQAELSF